MTDKERHATIWAWVEVFRKEGDDISYEAISSRLKEAEVVGETARLRTGRILLHGFYPESQVRELCHDLLNPLNTEYFSDPSYVLHDLTAYATQLGEGKTPLELNTNNFRSLSIICYNGETVKGATYLSNAAVALGFAKDNKEGGSKHAETLTLLFKVAGIEVRDSSYYQNKEFVLHDLTAYASQLGEGKTSLDLSTFSLASLSVTCHNGKTVRGETYLNNAVVALGLAKNAEEARSKQAETLQLLLKTAGFEATEYPERNSAYYQNKESVLHDLTAYAQLLGPDKTPLDLNTGKLISLSAICHNGETVKGETYINNAAIALGLAKKTREASSKKAETLRKLKEIVGLLPESTESND